MPLPNDDWAKGKCGLKALQYMSLEIPALVSPVGVNANIVDHESNGYHCSSASAWLTYLSHLIERKDVREEMGKKAREKVVNHYSVLSNSENFLSLFE